MLDTMRRALDVSKILGTLDPDHHSLTFEEVFRLATLGGSQGQTQTPHGDLELCLGLQELTCLTVHSLVPGPPNRQL